MVEATCPFCGQNALGVSPPLALAAMVVHLAENVSDADTHNWGAVNNVSIRMETGHLLPSDGTRHPILYGNSYG